MNTDQGSHSRDRRGRRDSFARKAVDNRQNLELFFIEQAVRHEVHGPHIVHAISFGSAGSTVAGTTTFRAAIGPKTTCKRHFRLSLRLDAVNLIANQHSTVCPDRRRS